MGNFNLHGITAPRMLLYLIYLSIYLFIFYLHKLSNNFFYFCFVVIVFTLGFLVFELGLGSALFVSTKTLNFGFSCRGIWRAWTWLLVSLHSNGRN